MVFRHRSGEALRTVEAVVPEVILRALPLKGRIYFLELLWPVAAVYVWRQDIANCSVVMFEDNDGARHNLLRAFSKDFRSSLLLAMFWGAAAAQHTRPWVDRVASKDNPADCLTKPGLSKSHLVGSKQVDPSVLQPFWDFLSRHLEQERFPSWDQLSLLMGPCFQ